MGNYRGGSRTGGHASVHLGNLQEAIKLVDGVGSGIDADLFDGKESSEYVSSSHTSVAATTAAMGHVQIGNGIAVASGIISVDVGDGVTLSGTSPNQKVQADVDGTSIVLTGTSPNKKISHADTSSQATVTNSGGTVIQSVTLDTYGHVTALASKALTPADISAVPTSDVVTTATANKILKLDANSKLPASITGDSDTVDGLHAASFMRSDANTSTTGTMSVGGRLTTSGDVLFQNNALIAADGGTGNIDHIWHDDSGAGTNETVGSWHFVSDIAYKASGNAGLRFGSLYGVSSATNYLAGKLGLGITSASAKLHVRNATVANAHIDQYVTTLIEDSESRLQILSTDEGDAASAIILTNSPATGSNKHWGIHHTGVGKGNRLDFGYTTTAATGTQSMTYTAPKMTITTDGNVGIGTPSPAYKLHVMGGAKLESTPGTLSIFDTSQSVADIIYDGGSNGTFIFKNSNAVAGAYTSFKNHTDAILLHMGNNGLVGIGTDTPSYKLDVNGQGRFKTSATIGAATPTNGAVVIEGGGGAGQVLGLDANEIMSKGSSLNIGTVDAYALILQTNGGTAITLESDNTATFTGVIKTSKMTWQVTFNPQEDRKTVTHNLGTANYMVALGGNSVARHAAWENKASNTVDIILDAPYTETILVDVILMAY